MVDLASVLLSVALVFVSTLMLFRFNTPPPVTLPSTLSKTKTLTLLIAHPDDETMFFAPSLQSLSKTHSLRIWCLSSGGAGGVPSVRRAELKSAASMLGLDAKNVRTLGEDDGGLEDGMGIVWSQEEVGTALERLEWEEGRGEGWITFDKGGVSGHVNHCSLLEGLQSYLETVGRAEEPVWVLESTGMPRKYSFWLEALWAKVVPYAPVKGKTRFVNTWSEWRQAQDAMVNGHESQMRWFRYGWVGIGRYLLVNELIEVGSPAFEASGAQQGSKEL